MRQHDIWNLVAPKTSTNYQVLTHQDPCLLLAAGATLQVAPHFNYIINT
jgi:hypothetical protein